MDKRKVTFGVNLPLVQPRATISVKGSTIPEVLLTLARQAEELGYAHLPVCDHVAVPVRWAPTLGTQWFDPFATLGFLAAATRRVQLLTNIVVVPYRSPLTVAKAIATLDVLSQGRVVFGVGCGYLKAEFVTLGVPFDQRGPITDEYLLAMKELWTKEVAQFDGRFCKFRDVILSPKPVQKPHPPVWVGGNSRAAVRRAVELADGWAPFQVTPQEVTTMLDFARSLPQFSSKADRFQVVVPFVSTAGKATEGQESQRALPSPAVPIDRLLQDVDVWTRAGATRLAVAFRARRLHELVDHMQWFAENVMRRYA